MNMTALRISAVLCGLFLLLFSCSTPLQPGILGTEVIGASVDAWNRDLDCLAAELPARHPDLFHSPGYDAETFAADIDQFKAAMDSLSPEERITELYRVMAEFDEGHTGVSMSPETYFPVLCRWFSDGLYVVAVDQSAEEALGMRVTSIGGVAVPEAESLLNGVINTDHAKGYRYRQPYVIINPPLMRGLGLAGTGGLTLELEGLPGTLTVEETLPGDISWVRVIDDLPEESLDLPRRSRDDPWWYSYDAGTEVLYLRYKDCSWEALPVLREVVNRVKREPVRALIVDLRDNGGGVSIPGTWFAGQIAGIPALTGDRGTFVLMNAGTFSSGVMNVVDFKRKTGALLAGEPLIQPANHYGEIDRFMLSETGIVICHSTKYFDYWPEADYQYEGGILTPDEGLEAEMSFEDYRSGADPVYRAVLNRLGVE